MLAAVLMMSTAIVSGVVMTDREAYAQNAAQASFNVPAGPLNRALTAFGRQAGLLSDQHWDRKDVAGHLRFGHA